MNQIEKSKYRKYIRWFAERMVNAINMGLVPGLDGTGYDWSPAIKQLNEELEEHIDENFANFTAHKADITANASALSTANQTIQSLTTSLALAVSKITSLEQQVTNLTAQTVAHKTSIQNLDAGLYDTNKRVASLEAAHDYSITDFKLEQNMQSVVLTISQNHNADKHVTITPATNTKSGILSPSQYERIP